LTFFILRRRAGGAVGKRDSRFMDRRAFGKEHSSFVVCVRVRWVFPASRGARFLVLHVA